jgi:hypothetical protein
MRLALRMDVAHRAFAPHGYMRIERDLLLSAGAGPVTFVVTGELETAKVAGWSRAVVRKAVCEALPRWSTSAV